MIQTFEQAFHTFTYPAGEPHVALVNLDCNTRYLVANNVRDFNGLMTLVTANRILRHKGREIQWVIPYFPFARHDRRNDVNDGVELHVAMEVAAELDPILIDPHSDVTARFKHIPQAHVVAEFGDHKLFFSDPVIAIPDAGASKKAHEWINGREYVTCGKHRDPATGKLDGFTVDNPALVADRTVVIVDDICDAGGTFLGLAETLTEAGALSLILAVTHGLFTKGLDALTAVFDEIWTLNTVCDLAHDQLMVVNTDNLIARGIYK